MVLPVIVPPFCNMRVEYVLAGKLVALFAKFTLPRSDEDIIMLDPLPVVVIVPELLKVVLTVRLFPATARAPAVMVRFCAVVLFDRVRALPLALIVRSVYVACGMVLVSVKVKLPLVALGIVI